MPEAAMKITTEEFFLTKSEYFKILVTNALYDRWFLFILFFGVSALGIQMTVVGIISHFLVFILISLVYLLYLVTSSALRSRVLRGHQFILSSRRCEIDHEFVAACFADGSLNKINFSHITKITVRKDHFLFYYARNQFIYLPLKAINNPTDVQALVTLIKVKFG